VDGVPVSFETFCTTLLLEQSNKPGRHPA
jgi:hypothetical protein